MNLEANGANLLLGRGKLYFDRFTSGTTTKNGLRFLGEASKFELNPTIQTKDKFSLAKSASTRLASNITQMTQECNIELAEFVPENLALALLGDTAIITQTGGAVTAEALSAPAKNGRVYKLANRQISALTIKKAGVATGVSGVDYLILDAKMGLIQINTGGPLTDGDTLTADYTAAAILTAAALTEIRGGDQTTIDGELVFVGDPANGLAYDADIWHVRINPAGALGFIGEDFGTLPLKFQILDDSVNHPTEPLYRIVQRP